MLKFKPRVQPKNCAKITLKKRMVKIDNKIVFTRVDKDNTVIAISKKEYVTKTKDFLHSFKILDSDPTPDYKKEISDDIDSFCFFDDKGQFPLNNRNP